MSLQKFFRRVSLLALIMIAPINGTFAQTVLKATPDEMESKYFESLLKVIGSIQSAKAVLDACDEEFPEAKDKRFAEYQAWRTLNSVLIQDIEYRFERVGNTLYKTSQEFESAQISNQKEMAAYMGRNMRSKGDDTMKIACGVYASLLRSRTFDIEQIRADELRVIRSVKVR